jgi:hypothetical protein
MADRSRSWTDSQRERIEASKAMPYLLDVVNGVETEPCEKRIRTCLALLNKRMPDMKSIEVKAEVAVHVPGFNIVHPN